MEEIEDFIAKFLELEKRIEEELLLLNLEEQNKLVDEILQFGTDDLILGTKKNEPLSRMTLRLIEEKKNKPVFQRFLFKISEYENIKYGKIWLFYTSLPNPEQEVVKIMSSCYSIARISNEFHIVAEWFPDYDTKLWKFGGGDRMLSDYYKLGNPTLVKRILSPAVDEWSIEEYNKDS